MTITPTTTPTAPTSGQILKDVSQKALAYIRVSGLSQSDGDGPVRQELAIRTFAGAHNIEVMAVYSDLGVSGTTENALRPEWTRMTADARTNDVQCIVIERLDRLARDLLVQETCIIALRKQGITLMSTVEPDLMATDPTRVLIRQLLGSLAEYDRSMTVAKLAAARARIRARGERCDGRLRYGARPGETAVIERMLALRTEGMAYQRIADRLNDAGIAARAGRWHGRSVNRTLSQMRSDAGARKAAQAAPGAPYIGKP